MEQLTETKMNHTDRAVDNNNNNAAPLDDADRALAQLTSQTVSPVQEPDLEQKEQHMLDALSLDLDRRQGFFVVQIPDTPPEVARRLKTRRGGRGAGRLKTIKEEE